MQLSLLFSVLRGKTYLLHTFAIYTTLHTDDVVKGWQDIGNHWTVRLRGYYFRFWEQRQYAVRVSVWTVSIPSIRPDVSTILTLVLSGTLSTVFLFMVDVEKSRVECEEFVAAEVSRDAFSMRTT